MGDFFRAKVCAPDKGNPESPPMYCFAMASLASCLSMLPPRWRQNWGCEGFHTQACLTICTTCMTPILHFPWRPASCSANLARLPRRCTQCCRYTLYGKRSWALKCKCLMEEWRETFSSSYPAIRHLKTSPVPSQACVESAVLCGQGLRSHREGSRISQAAHLASKETKDIQRYAKICKNMFK